jgi:hypothetical protein
MDGTISLQFGDRALTLRFSGKDRITTDAQHELRFDRDPAGKIAGFQLD